jgi:hypothetical protein
MTPPHTTIQTFISALTPMRAVGGGIFCLFLGLALFPSKSAVKRYISKKPSKIKFFIFLKNISGLY